METTTYNKYGQWVDGEWQPYDDMEDTCTK